MKIKIGKTSWSSGTIIKVEYVYDFTMPTGKKNRAFYFWFFNRYLKIGFRNTEPLGADRVIHLLKQAIQDHSHVSLNAEVKFNDDGDLAEYYKRRHYKWGRIIVLHDTLVEVAKAIVK